jgi:hypothetical protein
MTHFFKFIIDCPNSGVEAFYFSIDLACLDCATWHIQ